jgi:hypothetical protein
VVLQSVLIALAAMLAIPLMVPMSTRDAIVAVLAAVLGFVAMLGVAAADKLVPAAVGLVKAAFYLAVLLGAHGFWADPAFQASVIAVIELGSGLLVAQLVQSNVPVTALPNSR